MKRSILGLMYLIQGMKHAGIAVDERLASIGLHSQSLDPNSIIHPDLEWDIQKLLAKDVPVEVGLDIGQHYALAGYGPLLMLLVTSETVQCALDQGIQYQSLTHLSGCLRYDVSAGKIHLRYLPKHLDQAEGIFRAQCEIAGTLKFLKDLSHMVNLGFPHVEVSLPFVAPDDAQLLQHYQHYYGHDVKFNAVEAVFSLDQKFIALAIPSSDPITHRLYEEKCQIQMRHLDAQGSQQPLIQRVQDYLDLQKGAMPSMVETAQALNIPERTLRHQLQQLNTSFKEIREQLIKYKALRLIEYKEYSIEVIAEMLGYSEPAAFNHAFKRWFGQSPRQYGKS